MAVTGQFLVAADTGECSLRDHQCRQQNCGVVDSTVNDDGGAAAGRTVVDAHQMNSFQVRSMNGVAKQNRARLMAGDCARVVFEFSLHV